MYWMCHLDIPICIHNRIHIRLATALDWQWRLSHPPQVIRTMWQDLSFSEFKCESHVSWENIFLPKPYKKWLSFRTGLFKDLGPCKLKVPSTSATLWSSLMIIPWWAKSLFNFRYFVAFIDDNSLMTWLFLLRDLSEIHSLFKTFHNEALISQCSARTSRNSVWTTTFFTKLTCSYLYPIVQWHTLLFLLW